MRIYILGICGTFMGSLAVLAKEMGFQVAGCDENIYPPMSTQLSKAGIDLDSGYDVSYIKEQAIDLIVVGNALGRGNPVVEYMLNEGIDYSSGPEFLHDYLIKHKWVLAVSGTHGKTTTAAMLAWILESNHMAPGFLVGGVMQNFPFSARLGESDYFVIEADEYDTAFFDKRSKFVHYHPKTLIINNIEFDHADIFASIDDIKRQFHHLMRIIPANGTVIYPVTDSNITSVLDQGCWSNQQSFELLSDSSDSDQAEWQAKLVSADGTHFSVIQVGTMDQPVEIKWSLMGDHNVCNALAAIVAANHIGVNPTQAAAALMTFNGVKRRMEYLALINGITIYDDFAHHPTAIMTSLRGLRKRVKGRIIAVIELGSNTMKRGTHREALAESVQAADLCFWYFNERLDWQWNDTLGDLFLTVEALLQSVLENITTGDHVVLMSNSSFNGFQQKLLDTLRGSNDQ